MMPTEEVLAFIEAPQSVNVTYQAGRLVFEPAGPTPQVGFIFYPGGHVDYRAYAKPLSKIAEAGFLVVVVRMPLNLAILGVNRAEAVMDAFPQVNAWAIGGHSLGGAMASYFANIHSDLVDGLVLWGAYPPRSVELSGETNLQALVIYGELDNVVSIDEILATKTQFPTDTYFIVIEGGNHSQFGDYGLQRGDNPADVNPEVQQQAIIAATISLLKSLQNLFINP